MTKQNKKKLFIQRLMSIVVSFVFDLRILTVEDMADFLRYQNKRITQQGGYLVGWLVLKGNLFMFYMYIRVRQCKTSLPVRVIDARHGRKSRVFV